MNPVPVSEEEIQLGCLHQNEFYPLAPGYKVGYWHKDHFNDIEEGDLSQVQGASPVCFAQNSGTFSWLSEGDVPGFLYKGSFYKTRQMIPGYMEGLTIRLNQSAQIQPSSVSNDLRRSATGRQHGTKKCSICMEHPAEYQKLATNYCLRCLKKKYLEGNLYCGEGDNRIYWTPQMIAEVHTVLSSRLPPEEKSLLPETIPSPSDSVICIGHSETLIQCYPPKGHFVGYSSLCMESGCPNGHRLCKKCANRLENCPECGEFIWYEEPPSKCTRCGTDFCYEFEQPCIKCHEKPSRRKPDLFAAQNPTFPRA